MQWTYSVNKPHIDLSERKIDAMAQWMQRHDADVIFGVPAVLISEKKVIEVDFTKVV